MGRARASWVWYASVAVATGWLLAGSFSGCGGDEAVNTGGTGGSGIGGEGGQGGEQLNCVIDGDVADTEQCDDGNQVSGDGCENDCSWTCTQGTIKGDEYCDDDDLCNGVETCGEDHACTTGTSAEDGTECGTDMICKDGVCGDDVCGDLFVSDSEDCDDGNVTDGDGCDDCEFSCVSSDPNACEPADPCEGQGTCDDNTHTCSPGTPLSDGTPCGTDAYCLGGQCIPALCGNGTLDPGEDCDDNNLVDGDGCEHDCTLSCVNPANDCPQPPVCQLAQCSQAHVCETAPDPNQDGNTCGTNLVCNNGACIAPSAVCGNGILETGEDCDFGTSNGPNTGCELTCAFSCTIQPDSCPDTNTCNGTETCGQVTVNGSTGQACSPGTALANCTACTGGLCNGGTCQPSTCGDGCVDGGQGEQCEPPNTPTCSATCTNIICGNSVREGNEQCDDGNTTNNDGCDALCLFEQVDRANWLKMQWGTDTFCPANALGGAIDGGMTRSELESSVDDGVADGSISIIIKMLDLDDLTGTSDNAVQLGVINGSPETNLAPYNGTNDLDWWYYPDPLTIDGNGVPLNQLSGSISAKLLTAGPGSISIAMVFSGNPATLDMSDTSLTILLGATSTPLSSTGVPPGHEASENLDPGLISYESGGQPTTNGSGKLCGKVSAASLAQVPIPSQLVGTGLLSCTQGYSAQNTLLDVLVSGCNVLWITQISPTQPDTDNSTLPNLGSGPLYTLQANNQNFVDTCLDSQNNQVNLQDCLNDAAYSAFFKYATGRIILK
ncbi:MAG: DUF4215 domain-containing protein [Deltaproteobacteria bacterium]|nr:DUF4215 domain-containing protein [Deltaproteobacteria bacterium]